MVTSQAHELRTLWHNVALVGADGHSCGVSIVIPHINVKLPCHSHKA